MAFKMPTLFGAKPPSAPSDDFDMPTTQDPSATGGINDKPATTTPEQAKPPEQKAPVTAPPPKSKK